MIILKIIFCLIATFGVTAFLLVWLIAGYKILLKYTWFRWIVESIMYHEHVAQIRMLTDDQKIEKFANWEVYPRRFHKYWYGKALKKKLLKESAKAVFRMQSQSLLNKYQ
jgi:hypothetical protein